LSKRSRPARYLSNRSNSSSNCPPVDEALK